MTCVCLINKRGNWGLDGRSRGCPVTCPSGSLRAKAEVHSPTWPTALTGQVCGQSQRPTADLWLWIVSSYLSVASFILSEPVFVAFHLPSHWEGMDFFLNNKQKEYQQGMVTPFSWWHSLRTCGVSCQPGEHDLLLWPWLWYGTRRWRWGRWGSYWGGVGWTPHCVTLGRKLGSSEALPLSQSMGQLLSILGLLGKPQYHDGWKRPAHSESGSS